MGALESLQNAVCEMLRSLNGLKFAYIRAGNGLSEAETGSPEGVEIRVLRPMPLSASKYAAGPAFSDVELRVETERSKFAAPNAPSLLSACETVSRALHGAVAPAECGYGRISLAENSPWSESECGTQSEKITMRFRAQSVLQ